MLQPWLDFAALMGFTEEAPLPWEASPEFMDRFLEQYAGLKTGKNLTTATRFPAKTFFPLGDISDRSQAAREFYLFYWTVRSLFEWMGETWAVRDEWPDLWGSKQEFSFAPFRLPSMRAISIHRSGFVWLADENPAESLFLNAINGIALPRLRRCPILECRKIFYATRDNTGACREHLARARVQRGRDPELRRQYEETRRINRLVRSGMPLDKAKGEVKGQLRKHRAVQ